MIRYGLALVFLCASQFTSAQEWTFFNESLGLQYRVWEFEEDSGILYALGGQDNAGIDPRFPAIQIIGDEISFFGDPNYDGIGTWKSMVPFQDELIFGGTSFQNYADNLDAKNIMSWDGIDWGNLDQGLCCLTCEINSMMSKENSLIVAGKFSSNMDCNESFWANMAVWSGSSWSKMGGTTGPIKEMLEYDEKIVVVGDFISASLNNEPEGIENFIEARRIAWTANGEWGTFGGGCNGVIQDAIIDANNNLIVVGGFTNCDGVEGTNGVAVWNGEIWQALGNALPGYPVAIEYYRGQLYVAGGILFQSGENIAVFDGTNWQPIPSSNIEEGVIYDLKVFEDYLYVGGRFDNLGDSTCYGLAKYYLHPDSVVWDTTTNIQSFKEPRVSIFPNPASHRVNIRFDGVTPLGSEYRILSSSGQELHTDVIREDTFKLDLRKWSPGLIILEIQTTHGVLREKILIE